MFNKTIVSGGPSHVTHTTHEHRAPTDESIKIFKEIKDKSEASVIADIQVKNTVFEGRLVVQDDPCKMCHVANYKIKLNGVEFENSIELHDGFICEPAEITDNFYNLLTKAIFRQIVEMNTGELHFRQRR